MIVGTLPCGATETHGYAQMRRGMVDLFAVTTRGLETVSAAEMAALPGVIVGTTGYRRVTARVAAPDPALLTLRTIDDLFADVATWEAIGPERAALATMGTYSARIDLRPAAAVCGAVRGRPIRREPAFSVTARLRWPPQLYVRRDQAGVRQSYRGSPSRLDLHARRSQS